MLPRSSQVTHVAAMELWRLRSKLIRLSNRTSRVAVLRDAHAAGFFAIFSIFFVKFTRGFSIEFS